jgi:hypothetical protein
VAERFISLARGSTRLILLLGPWAIKLPNLTGGWRLFLCGLLGNLQEAEFARAGWPELCPVLWAMPGGLLIVMPRAAPLPRWYMVDFYRLDRGAYVLPVELKHDSFGLLNGRVVAIDYGS